MVKEERSTPDQRGGGKFFIVVLSLPGKEVRPLRLNLVLGKSAPPDSP